MNKYLFLYLKTGKDHLAPSKVSAEKNKTKGEPDTENLCTNILSETNTVVKNEIKDGYKNSINYAACTYEFLYALYKISFFSKTTAFLVSLIVKPGIERQILETNPGKIVIFHFLLIKPVFEIIKKYRLDIQILTVVTDPFTSFPVWFHQEGRNYIVFTDISKEKCLERDIRKENLHVFPFVLDSNISQKVSDMKKASARKKLGFEADSKIILIIGGSDGMFLGKKILWNIVTRNMDAEIVIVCGKNQKLFNKSIKLKNSYGFDNLKVYGFIDLVPSLVSISDVVITKSSTSASMELHIIGKIPVINNFIWGQEKGIKELVRSSKMGIPAKHTRYLPDVLHRLLIDNEFYASISNNIKNEALTDGVDQVSDYMLKYL